MHGFLLKVLENLWPEQQLFVNSLLYSLQSLLLPVFVELGTLVEVVRLVIHLDQLLGRLVDVGLYCLAFHIDGELYSRA